MSDQGEHSPGLLEPAPGVANVPSYHNYNNDVVWLFSSEELYVVVTGVLNQPIVAVARVTDYPEAAVSARGM